MAAPKTVFVVDDDPSMLKGVERILKHSGFNSQLFDSVDDFHSRARLQEAACLVLDIDLNGESGIELSREVATSGFPVPVIFITGKDSDRTRKAAFEAGCIAYFGKPFEAKSLMAAIEKAIAHTK